MNTLPSLPPDTDNQLALIAKAKARRRRILWLLILILALVLGGYYLWGRSKAPVEGGANGKRQWQGSAMVIPVGVAAATTSDVNIYLSGLGAVTATATATVKSRVDGPLIKLHFKEGALVKSGDLLAEIDPQPYRILVDQADGQLMRDRALLSAAQIDLKRYNMLLSQDSIASQQVDTQAALVKQYEGTVKVDQGLLDNARLNLSYTRVTAPISGRLGLRVVDLGNIVHASDTTGLVIITQEQPITAVFSIPEDNIPAVMKQLQSGKQMPAQAWDRDLKNRLDNGQLLTIDNQVDATTGTVKLKAQFPNADYALFPNQFVNIRLLLDVRKSAIVVPGSAVQRGSSGLFVYLVKPDQTVTVRPVKTGPVNGEQIIIESGIVSGETVVIDGVDRLREGAKVEAIVRGGANDPANKLTEKSDKPARGKRPSGSAGSRP
ncbi:MdtA/MuxA family multidrug efflux RND transporter periplasmic adaptor subunit [Herbaspirillum sp. RTI4]|uniref:MdtA/MuxA family multidrug efflux RND transporter periplasmic adaptor subunit n=1 Tax=Herbaspirillum sp. RTI4 TaxID=3048640 RepID=UPI002AB51EA7|nr:MdtA/MuxA family multidrug efflux RND transporter periplasmic adaptor subunit [Herbaspirillum sp. RTI4]MDY7579823.1 MdtA/MuxA family multidrug efflux RND transporter periplasmic adaptor subunit [Herbaspirillum sp. RTI4]MEA9981910.1 MdtA/MuxA family multidrug efflux RND transporter periplasmic adaptor subunit [Herbaspirillum sp. RTI4]